MSNDHGFMLAVAKESVLFIHAFSKRSLQPHCAGFMGKMRCRRAGTRPPQGDEAGAEVYVSQ